MVERWPERGRKLAGLLAFPNFPPRVSFASLSLSYPTNRGKMMKLNIYDNIACCPHCLHPLWLRKYKKGERLVCPNCEKMIPHSQKVIKDCIKIRRKF